MHRYCFTSIGVDYARYDVRSICKLITTLPLFNFFIVTKMVLLGYYCNFGYFVTNNEINKFLSSSLHDF